MQEQKVYKFLVEKYSTHVKYNKVSPTIRPSLEYYQPIYFSIHGYCKGQHMVYHS